MNINWYPGHIAKAKAEIIKQLKQVDIIIEILDLRAPISTKNYSFDDKINNKKHLLILNKSDLADDKKNKFYVDYYKNKNYFVLKLQANKNNISQLISNKLNLLCKDVINKQNEKGINNYQIKVMVIGYPNVGKSTFINSYKKKSVQETKNIPGVTKQNKWIQINDNIFLLDTPGITETKFQNDTILKNLVLINSINENIINKQDLCYDFLKFMIKNYKQNIIERYNLIDFFKTLDEIMFNDDNINELILKLFCEISKKIGSIKNNQIDYDKTSNVIINDFRNGKLGRITLYEEID